MTGRRPAGTSGVGPGEIARSLVVLCGLLAGACRDRNEPLLEVSWPAAPGGADPGEAAPAAFPTLASGGLVAVPPPTDPAGPVVRLCVSRLVQSLMAGGVLEEVQARTGMRLQLDVDSDRGAALKLAVGQTDCALFAGPLTGRDHERGLLGAEVGSYVVAIISHPQNPVQSVSSQALRQLLTGAVRDWSELGAPSCAVEVFALPLGDATDARNLALAIPADSLPSEVVRVSDPLAVCRKVQGTAGGLGMVPLGVALANGARQVAVDNAMPSQQGAAAGYWPYAAPLVLATRAGTNVSLERLAEALRRSPAWRRALGD